MPSTAVYFAALPPSIALMAARLMFSGVSKSGSPAPNPITSRPAALSARALSVTAMVADGLMRLSDSASRAMRLSAWRRELPNRRRRRRQVSIADAHTSVMASVENAQARCPAPATVEPGQPQAGSTAARGTRRRRWAFAFAAPVILPAAAARLPAARKLPFPGGCHAAHARADRELRGAGLSVFPELLRRRGGRASAQRGGRNFPQQPAGGLTQEDRRPAHRFCRAYLQ